MRQGTSDAGPGSGEAAFTRSMKIVWLVMTLSVLAYGLALYWVTTGQTEPISSAWAARLRIPFAGIATALGMIAYWMRRYAFEPSAIQAELDAGRSLTAALCAQQPNFMLLLGIHETIALLGFVLGVLEGGLGLFAPYAAAATALNLLAYPRFEALFAELRARNPQLTSDVGSTDSPG